MFITIDAEKRRSGAILNCKFVASNYRRQPGANWGRNVPKATGG